MIIFSALSNCYEWLWKTPFSSPSIPEEVVLHKGDKVSKAALTTTLQLLKTIESEEFILVYQADLWEKATNPSYTFASFLGRTDPRNKFKEWGLIDEKDNMSKEHSTIIRNCFRKGNFGVVPTDPLTGKDLKEDYSWKELQEIFS